MTRYAVDDRADGSLVVSIDQVAVLTYVYRSGVAQSESPRPYFHPLTTLGGASITQFRPADHDWHHGLSLALPNVISPTLGPHNFWGGPTYVRDAGYQQLPNNGSVTHRGFTALVASADGVEIEEMLQWTSFSGALVFTEKRRLTIRAADDSWSLLFETVLRNASGEALRLGSPGTEGRTGAGYGGLFWRGPAELEGGALYGPALNAASDDAAGQDAAGQDAAGDDAASDDAAGQDAAGQDAAGDDAMGSRGEWMAYSGTAATVVMADRPENPRHPTPWFVRTDEYAGLGPAPFFFEAMEVPAGEKIRLGYTVTIADGASDFGRASALAGGQTPKEPS